MRSWIVILVVATVVVAPLPVVAQPSQRIYSFVLPSRDEQLVRLEVLTAQVARRVAARSGGRWSESPLEALDLGDTLTAAARLQREGALDEAALSYDTALTVAIAAPHRVADPERFVDALLARASIALARAEPERAAELLQLSLTYDPGVELTPEERRPRISTAWSKVRTTAGNGFAVSAETLGTACRDLPGTLIIGRPIGGGRAEITMFRGCRLERQARVSLDAADPSKIAAILMGDPLGGDPVLSPAPPDAKDVDSGRSWLWITAGVAAVGVLAGGTWFVLRQGSSESVHVRVHR